MVRLLEEIAVDPMYEVDDDNPLRQVIINTHSPVVVNSVDPADLIYLDEKILGKGSSNGRIASLRVMADTWRAKLQQDAPPVALGQIEPYLMGPQRDRRARSCSISSGNRRADGLDARNAAVAGTSSDGAFLPGFTESRT